MVRDTPAAEGKAGGITCQWTAMGEGCTDLGAFFDLFERACPGVAVPIETISGFPRTFPIYQREFWKLFPDGRAEDLAAFLALAKRARPIEPFTPPARQANATISSPNSPAASPPAATRSASACGAETALRP